MTKFFTVTLNDSINGKQVYELSLDAVSRAAALNKTLKVAACFGVNTNEVRWSIK